MIPVDFLSESAHTRFDDIGLGVEVVSPYMLHNHRLGYHARSVPHQVEQERILFRLKIDTLASTANFVLEHVQAQIANLEERGLSATLCPCALAIPGGPEVH